MSLPTGSALTSSICQCSAAGCTHLPTRYGNLSERICNVQSLGWDSMCLHLCCLAGAGSGRMPPNQLRTRGLKLSQSLQFYICTQTMSSAWRLVSYHYQYFNPMLVEHCMHSRKRKKNKNLLFTEIGYTDFKKSWGSIYSEQQPSEVCEWEHLRVIYYLEPFTFLKWKVICSSSFIII